MATDKTEAPRGADQRRRRHWFKLDNAAILFPTFASGTISTLFRLSMTLDEPIRLSTLEEALELFRFPRSVGNYEDKEILVGIGRFGPFVRHGSLFYSIPRGEDPGMYTEEAAITLILAKRKEASEKLIREFAERPDIKVLNGRYGPYIAFGKTNVKIPKGTDPAGLSLQDCERLAAEAAALPPKKKPGKKS